MPALRELAECLDSTLTGKTRTHVDCVTLPLVAVIISGTDAARLRVMQGAYNKHVTTTAALVVAGVLGLANKRHFQTKHLALHINRTMLTRLW